MTISASSLSGARSNFVSALERALTDAGAHATPRASQRFTPSAPTARVGSIGNPGPATQDFIDEANMAGSAEAHRRLPTAAPKGDPGFRLAVENAAEALSPERLSRTLAG